MKINYLSSAKKGIIRAHGRCLKLGRIIGVSEASITNEDQKILAHGIVTVMIRPPIEFPGIDQVPSKFI